MVGPEEIGKEVVIVASDDFYAYVNGWAGTLKGFESGHGIVHVPDGYVRCGYKRFLVPPDQLRLK